MKYMLQIIGFTEARFAEGEGPTGEEFMAWEQSLAEAGIRVDGGFLDAPQWPTRVQVGPGG